MPTSPTQPAGELVERVRQDEVVSPQPAPLGVEDPGVTQHLQVMGDGGLGQIEQRDELAHANLAGVLPEYVDELKADRVSERLGNQGHALGFAAFEVGVDARLAARLASWSFVFRCELEFDRHLSSCID